MSDQVAPADVIPLRPDDQPVLFISHRHDDRAIADALRQFIEARTGGAVAVFQSSSSEADHPRPGTSLTEELRRVLWHSGVVVLLYTTRDQDWSYCMWECGVAQLPEPASTKTIVFQCADHFPDVFADQLRVGLRNEQDIEKFVNAFLTDANYFPTLGRAVTSFNSGAPQVKRAAKELHERLQEVLPLPEDVGEEWPPYPQLTLDLTDEQMERIRAVPGTTPAERVAATRKIVEQAMVVGGDSQLGRIFSTHGFPRNATMRGKPLSDLIANWKGSSPTPASRWVEGISIQISAAATGQFPSLRWELMRGADRNDSTWYGPVVRYVKNVPKRRCTEIDVVFCKFELDDQGTPRIGIPEVVAEE